MTNQKSYSSSFSLFFFFSFLDILPLGADAISVPAILASGSRSTSSPLKVEGYMKKQLWNEYALTMLLLLCNKDYQRYLPTRPQLVRQNFSKPIEW